MRECGQAVYGGCPGETCERDCSYQRKFTVINLNIEQCRTEMNRLVSIGINAAIAALCIAVFLFAANAGFSRVEHQHQIGRV